MSSRTTKSSPALLKAMAKYRAKNRKKCVDLSKAWYHRNAEALKLKRRQKYAAQKAAKLATVQIPPTPPDPHVVDLQSTNGKLGSIPSESMSSI